MELSDSVPILATFETAWNSGSISAILGFFTDDARILQEPAPAGASGSYSGKQEILDDFLMRELPGSRVSFRSHHAEEGSLTWMAIIANDSFRSMKIEEAECACEAELAGMQFKSLILRLTPATVEKLPNKERS